MTSLIIGHLEHGPPAKGCALSPSLTVHLSRRFTSLPSPGRVPAYLPYGTVTCLALIDRSPPAEIPLPYKGHLYYASSSLIPRVSRRADVEPRFFGARILRNIPHDVIQTLPKGRYYRSLRWKTIWGWFVLCCLFDVYCFLVQLLATSLTMAVRDRVESSSALPPRHSP